MQYALLRNATPPNQASFRLRIDAGSLMENEDQLGLAHFMEHMAFNGTTNIPENDLLRILERRGLAFGADTNAYTGFDETVYMLEIPNADEGTVDDALRILREQMSEALMAEDAVEAERNVIVGEERLRNTPGLRSIKAQLGLYAPGQRVSNRLPIGDLEIIRTAPRQRFVEFYEAYYRPERATFVAVGALSAAFDDTYVRLILGDAYVNMTLENIESGDPMAVYKKMNQMDMFLGFTLNNVMVSFYAFVAGILFSVGTVYVLLQNGIMLGVFHYFFYERGLILPFLLSVYIHGALEISAIVLAGGAGLVMGNSILFPGTYPRLTAFRRGAQSGMKMVLGLVPLFIVAGFLEGFVTRYTTMPLPVSLLIIGGSFAFVIWYVVLYPARLARASEPV